MLVFTIETEPQVYPLFVKYANGEKLITYNKEQYDEWCAIKGEPLEYVLAKNALEAKPTHNDTTTLDNIVKDCLTEAMATTKPKKVAKRGK